MKKKTVFEQQQNDPLYRAHLQNLPIVRHLVDNRPPRLLVETVLKTNKLRSDQARLKQVDFENRVLLQRINEINRTKGCLDTFQHSMPKIHSNCGQLRANSKLIDRQNQFLLYRLFTMKPVVETRDALSKDWQKKVALMRQKTKFDIVLKELL